MLHYSRYSGMPHAVLTSTQRCHMLYLPTYPGVPHAVAIVPDPSIFDNPKSLIMILESSAGL